VDIDSPGPIARTRSFDFVGNARWSALGSYHHQFTPAFGASLSAQYFSDFYEGGTSLRTGLDGYSGELALVWTPVEEALASLPTVFRKALERGLA